MKRSMTTTALALVATAGIFLAGCAGGESNNNNNNGDGGGATDADVTLRLAGWSLATTPEFEILVDGFEADNPGITIEVVDYDAANYETQLTADLAAGSAPDLYTLKNVSTFPTYQGGGQLLDVSDVADGLSDGINGLENYQVDGATFAVPYRQDAWYLYYNKDLFDLAGVEYPDGTWTWDDYVDVALDMRPALEGAGSEADSTYLHFWNSTVQGFANTQAATPEQYLSAEWDYMIPYYERALALQDAGAQVSFGTVTTNSLTYQAQFGTQQAAMMLMGSWYVATLLAQQESGDADTFNWGFAPVPQLDGSTAGAPVSQGNPTAIGVNAAIDDSKVDAAKAFLAYIGSEEASSSLAAIGIMPAYSSPAVAESMFAIDGIPADEISQAAFLTQEPGLEAALGEDTPALQGILNDAHSEIMSGSISPEEGIAAAMERAQSEVLG